MRTLFALPILGLATALATPAAAQTAEPGAGEKVRYQIVYGEDKCEGAQSSDEIVVCARMDESERYRIPPALRGNPDAPQNQAWTNRVKSLEYVGRTGTGSCSPAGAGGFTGCTQKMIAAAYDEKHASGEVQFGKIVEAEREKRLSTIDAEAAEQQKRVEEAEKAYLEKQGKAQEAAESPAASPDAPHQ